MSFVDARKLRSGHTIEADICIVGSGAAGLAMASSFLGGSRRVVLLESGGMRPDPAIQALHEGRSVGALHAPLHEGRLRFFGGTTNHWTAHVKPLDPIDFEKRPWVPHSGWPLRPEDLTPFYERAQQFLRLRERAFDLETWRSEQRRPWDFEGGRVETRVRQIVLEENRRFGPRLEHRIAGSENVDTYLFANVLRIELAEAGGRVERLRVSTLDGVEISARARTYVLATGGIENARILLLSSIGGGADAEQGLVGRFYSNHPESVPGRLQIADASSGSRFYQPRRHVNGTTRAFLRLSPAVQREAKLLNCWIELRPAPASGPLDDPVARLARDVDAGASDSPPGPVFQLYAVAEQAPNPASRVRLGDEVDRFGQPRVVLDWQLQEIDSQSVRRTFEIFAREVGASGLGRVQIQFPAEGFEKLDARGSHHHMGTTRMHADPKQGVVDANCRVHGVPNLYVAGSSVFPTYGTANPTLTIMALAFRLADHLAAGWST